MSERETEVANGLSGLPSREQVLSQVVPIETPQTQPAAPSPVDWFQKGEVTQQEPEKAAGPQPETPAGSPQDLFDNPAFAAAMEPFMAHMDSLEEQELMQRIAEAEKLEKQSFALESLMPNLSPREQEILKVDAEHFGLINKVVAAAIAFHNNKQTALAKAQSFDEAKAEQLLTKRGMAKVMADPNIDAWIENNHQKFREITKGKIFALEYPATWRKIINEMKKSGASAATINQAKTALQEAQDGTKITEGLGGTVSTAVQPKASSREEFVANELRRILTGA